MKVLTTCFPLMLIFAIVLTAPLAFANAVKESAAIAHGKDDAKKIEEGHKDLYILKPGQGWTDHTYEFIQNYVKGLNSTKSKDWRAGYNYGTKEWDYYCPGCGHDNATLINGTWWAHHFECPSSKAPQSNFCLGYDAYLAYENSAQ